MAWYDDLPEAQNATPGVTPAAPPPAAAPLGPPAAPSPPWYGQLPEAQNAKPGPRQDTLLPNAPYNFYDMLAHNLSFGASDPVHAGVQAGLDWAFGAPNAPPGAPPAGFDYQKRAEEIARGRRQFEAEHPYQAAGALAASLPLAPVKVPGSALTPQVTTAAPSLLGDLSKSIGVGTVGGGIAGAADNPEAPVSGAGTGAALGAVGGAVMPFATRAISSVAGGLRNLWDQSGTATQNAVTKLTSLINDDIKQGAPTLAQADARLGNTDAPLSLADIYPSVKRHLGALYDSWSPAATSIFNQLNQRDLTAGQRLIGTTGRTVASGPTNFMADQALRTQQQTAARPAYGNFEMAPAPNPDLFAPGGDMTALLRRPVVQQGMKEALTNVANRGEDPNTLGITFNAAGDPVFQSVPSWRTLDYVKQGIDTALNKNLRNPITGKLDLKTDGGAQMAAHQDFVSLMDRENPLYAPARAAYSGPAASMRALELGSDFRDHPTDQQQYILSTLDPAARQFYQLGAANRIKSDIEKTADSGDEAKRIANSVMMRERLRPAFDSDAEYNQFLAHVNDERNVFQTGVDITGNSATARRQGAMATATPPSPASMAIPAAAISLVSGGSIPHAIAAGALTAGGHAATGWFNKARQLASGNSPDMQRSLASFALAPGQAGRGVIGLLQSPQERLMAPWLPGTMLSSQVPSFLQADPKGLLSQ